MKRILILCCLIWSVAYGQSVPGYTKVAGGYNYIDRISVGAGITIPAGTTPAFGTSQWRRSGALFYDSTGADSGLYVSHGPYWVKVGVGTVTGATNGLTLTGTNIGLGGTLSSSTTVAGAGNPITFDSLGNYIAHVKPTGYTSKAWMKILGEWDDSENGSNFFSTSENYADTAYFKVGINGIVFKKTSASQYQFKNLSSTIDTTTYKFIVADANGNLRRANSVAQFGGGTGSSYTFTKGLTQSGGIAKIDNNRNIEYITQPTSGASLGTNWTAVGGVNYTVSNGTFIFSGNADDATQYIRYDLGILAEGSYVECTVFVDSLRTTSPGLRIGWKSYNSYSGSSYAHDVYGGAVTGSGVTGYGKSIIYGKTGNSSNYSDSAITISPGDTYTIRVDRDGLNYTIRVYNQTTGKKLYDYVSTTPSGSPFVAHNSSYLAVFPGGGGYRVSGLKYVIKAPIQTENFIIGNSITYGQGAAAQGGRFADNIGNPSLNIVSGGGADGTASVLARIGEVIAVKPKRALLMIGGNDILFGVSSGTWQANYTAIRDSLVNNGIEVVHCLPTPRTATDVSALKNFIDTSATFRSDLKIDTWTSLASGTSLLTKYNLDGTHPNDAGHAQISSLINTGLNYRNSDALYAGANVYAYNGVVVGRTTTSGDANNYGGLKALLSGTSKTSYITIGKETNLGIIEARTEGSAYDPIAIAPWGNTKVGIGTGTTAPSTTLEVRNTTAGSTELLSLNHGGSFSANNQEIRMNFQNAGTSVGRISSYVQSGSKFGFRLYTYGGAAFNSSPVITFTGDNDITFGKIPTLKTDTTNSTGAKYLGINLPDSSLVIMPAPTNTAGSGITSLGGQTGTTQTFTEGYGIGIASATNNHTITLDSATVFPAVRATIPASSGSYINSQNSSAQTARFWITGQGFSDSAFAGRTTGASSGFKTGGLRALASTGTTSYLQLGYDATLAAGWFQAVTEGSAYRDVIFNAAGGNVGIGVLSTLPSVLVHLKKANYPAIRFEKTGTGSWYIGNRTEGSGTDFHISYNTTDHVTVTTGGSVGIGVSPTAAFQVRKTTEQIRTEYDASNYYSTTVGSTGTVTLNAVGSGALFSYSDPVNVPAGSSSVRVGGSFAPVLTTVGNVGTGEDDLQTFTVPAGTLATDGDYIDFEMTFYANASSATIKVYWGATQLGVITTNSSFPVTMVKGKIYRTGATSQRINWEYTNQNNVVFPGYTTAAETLSGAVTLKGTGEGTSNDDVTQTILQVRYNPKP